MPAIPPGLPPTSGNYPPNMDPNNAAVVNQLKQLWDQWYQHPDATTGQALLDFLKKNQDQIIKIANHYPNIMPLKGDIPTIQEALNTAITNLQGWLDHGANTSPIACSEWVKDVYDWISYAR